MNGQIYVSGDLCEFTGESQVLNGGLFHQVRVLEGHLTGKLLVVRDAAEKEKEYAEKLAARRDQQAQFARLHQK
jgi:hypothetical protein